jgi:D-alanyl-D-alanine carboxypeptidase (penicillin-binding protein 5/6)
MALIAEHAMTFPKFHEIVNTKEYTLPPTNKNSKEKVLYNSNKLLGNSKYYYQYAIGMKTGYTTIAGSTFVGAAKKGDIELICVVLNSPIEGNNSYMYLDSIKMFNYAFDNFEVYKSYSKSHVIEKVKAKGGNQTIQAIPENDLNILIPKGTNPKDIIITSKINDNISAPVKKGEIIGYLTIGDKGKNLGKVNIIAGNEVEEGVYLGLSMPKDKTFLSISWFIIKWLILVIVSAVMLLIAAAVIYNKYLSYKRRRRNRLYMKQRRFE